MTRARNSANLASDGNLFVNISDDRTGIGSLSPTHKLHVAGTSFFDDDVLFRGANTGRNCTWDKSTRALVFDGNNSVNGNYAKARFSASGTYAMDVYNNLNNFVEVAPNVALFVKTCDLQVMGSGSRGGTTYDNAILRARTGIVELGHEIGNGGASGYKLATAAYGVNVTGTTDTDGLVVSGVATVTTMNVTGVLTYDDVTSVDSVGIVTARQGVHIDDSIVHIGDPNTKIRFPSNDTVTVETGGSTRLQINDNNIQVIDNPLIIIRSTVAGNSDLNFGDSADGDTGQIRYRHDDNYMSFTVNTAERLRIDSSGNVGIDQTNPSAYGKFVVNGTGNVISLRASSGAASLGFFEAGTGRFYIKTLNGSDGLAFVDGDNSSERIRIDSNGRLLVNRTSTYASSSERLSVNGMTSIQGSSTSTAPLYVFNTESTADGTVQPFFFLHDGSGIRGGLGLQYNTSNFIINAQNVLQFRTGSSGVGGTEKMRLTSSGRLLIGHTASIGVDVHHAALQVNGDNYNESTISIISNSSNSNGAYLFFAKQRSGSAGGTTIVQDGDTIGQIRFLGMDGADYDNPAATIEVNCDGTPGSNDIPGRIKFSTGDGGSLTERVRIDHQGQMGLGVTPTTGWPSNGDFRALQIGTGIAVFGRGSGDEDRGGIAANYYHTGSAGKYIGNGHAGRIYFEDGSIVFSNTGPTANSSGANAALTLLHRMIIDPDGDVLVGGHTSPLSTYNSTQPRLSIYKSSGSGGYLELGGNIPHNSHSSGTILFINNGNSEATSNNANGKILAMQRVENVTSDTNAGNDMGGDLVFMTKPEAGGLSERLRIRSSGEVNIGGNYTQTTTPFSVTTNANDFGIRLLSGTNSVCDILNNDSAGNCEIRGYYNNNSGSRGEGFRLESNGESFIHPGGTNAFSVKQNGNVHIEDTSLAIGNPSAIVGRISIKGTNNSNSSAYSPNNAGGKAGQGIDITCTTVGNNALGGAISFGCGGNGRSAIAAYQDGSDDDRNGLVFYTHDSVNGSDATTEKIRIYPNMGVSMQTNNTVNNSGNNQNGVGYNERTRIYPYWVSDTGACRFNITMGPGSTIATPQFWIFTNTTTNMTGTVEIGGNNRTNAPNNAVQRFHHSKWNVGMYGEGDNDFSGARWRDSQQTQRGNTIDTSGGYYYVHSNHSEYNTNANQYQNFYGGWYWHLDNGSYWQGQYLVFDMYFSSGGTGIWYAYIND